MTSRRMVNLVGELCKLEKGILLRSSPELATSVHWTPAEHFPVHRWFRYREGFSPYLLDYFPEAKYRLDPFCGCGTTLLESARRGIPSCGIDVNPLATFVTRVKTRRYSGVERVKFLRTAKQACSQLRTVLPAPRPAYELLEKLFLPKSFDVLLRLRSCIEQVQEKRLHDLLKLAWLSILEDASNVFKEGNGLKYRNKRRRPGKYETIEETVWIPSYFGKDIRAFVLRLWETKCSEIGEDIESFRLAQGTSPTIRTGSCLESSTLDFGRQFDFVVFSPPYANRFDYFEAFKIELWMGDFVTTPDDMARLRRMSMRNNLATPRNGDNITWKPLQPFLDAMDSEASSVQMGIKQTLAGYFEDIRLLLDNLWPFLSRRCQIVIVVGNSAYAKSIVPTDLLIAQVARELGYRVKELRIARALHVSSQQRSSLIEVQNFMRESVLVLEKP